jgi:hypothetical protein
MVRFRLASTPQRLAVCLVVAGSLLSVGVAMAGPDSRHGSRDASDFLGLWQGVDPLDGSPVRLSLSDVNGDGTLELTQQDDFFTTCFNLDPATYSRGRGVVRGAATPARRRVLETKVQLTCLSDSNVPQPLPEDDTLLYTLQSGGRVLLLEFTDAPAVVLHRVAR